MAEGYLRRLGRALMRSAADAVRFVARCIARAVRYLLAVGVLMGALLLWASPGTPPPNLWSLGAGAPVGDGAQGDAATLWNRCILDVTECFAGSAPEAGAQSPARMRDCVLSANCPEPCKREYEHELRWAIPSNPEVYVFYRVFLRPGGYCMPPQEQ
jgi:hypothetical protein